MGLKTFLKLLLVLLVQVFDILSPSLSRIIVDYELIIKVVFH